MCPWSRRPFASTTKTLHVPSHWYSLSWLRPFQWRVHAVQYFENLEDCVAVVKKKYGRILTTKLGESSTPLFDLDLTAPTALAFGNERHGISEAFAALSDGNFNIPQVGMAGSLNISVACAVSMYEAFRQRGSSNEKNDHLLPSDQAKILFERWQEKQRLKRHQKP